MSGSGRAGGKGRPGPAAGRLDPDELAALEDQRDFLLRSLADLRREHAAGDLDDDDFRTLEDDYTSRAAETLRAIDEQRSAFADARRRSGPGRTLAIFGGVIAFAVVAGLLVASSLGARQAGDTATGGISVSKSPSQRAQACIGEMSPTAPTKAIECFQAVLDDDPRNPVAKTYLAWQLSLSASFLPDEAEGAELEASAQNLVDDAVAADPDYSPARAFRAIIATRRGEFALAETYLAEFRANEPSPEAESIIDQFDLEGQIAEGLAGTGTGTGTGDGAATASSTTVPADSPFSTTTTAPG